MNLHNWADCCDGSDEYDGQTKCPNTCWEAGKVAREKLRKKIATYQEGVTIRRQEIEKAKLAIVKEEAELQKLKDEENILKGLVDKLKGTFFFIKWWHEIMPHFPHPTTTKKPNKLFHVLCCLFFFFFLKLDLLPL